MSTLNMTLVGVAQSDAAALKRSISPQPDITLRSPLGSNPFVRHRRSHIASPEESRSPTTTLARPNYSSGPLEIGGGLGSDIDDVDDRGFSRNVTVTARHTSNDISALVDFFTNFPPPPENYMSMSTDTRNPERGRSTWCKLRKIGKRSRSVPRSPKQMRLPDSAVSGTTIGGHRHIAISIPLEAMPFADVPRSEHPIYPGQGAARKGPPASLRLDTRGSEAPSSTFSPTRPAYMRGQTLPPSQWIRSPETPGSQSPGARPFDHIGILPGQLQSTTLNDPICPWDTQGEYGAGRSGQTTPARQRTPLPVRSSSFAGRRGRGQPPSIDGLIAQQRRKPPPDCSKALPREPSPPRSRLGDNRSRLSDNVSKASVSSLDSSEWGKPKKSSAALGHNNERNGANKKQDGRSSALTVIADSPIVSHRDPSPPPPPPPPKVSCRKDMVRDKKRRDMQAIRTAKLKRAQSEGDASAMITPTTASLLRVGEPDTSGDDSKSQRLTISNMMIVADLEPSGSPRLKPSRSSAPPATVETQPNSPVETPRPRDPNMATPPISSNGSPPTRHATVDRTSLSRRREWRAVREQERKAREALALARLEAQHLAAGRESYDDGHASPIEKEVMCLYEAYREHRLKDMERRLRRLERNGDVWLRALVPVLDNVNRTLLAATNGDLENRRLSRNYVTEDEDVSRLRADRRASRQNLAQTKLLQKLARQRASEYKGDAEEEEDDDDEGSSNLVSNDTWTDSVGRSEDFSGLGSIEPLMRELASEGRRRQRASLIPRSFGSVSKGQEQQSNYGLTA